VKSIDEITVNPVLDSELEVRFVEAIKRIAMGEGHGLLGDCPYPARCGEW
jgi:hypothetical protein